MTSKKEIVVLGAGVIGLQTALILLEAGFGVTIVAKHWPGDEDIGYCSMKAGAHWRSHAAADDSRSQKFESETYKYWQTLAKSQGEDGAGVEVIHSRYIFDHPTTESHWWSNLVTSFRVIPTSELPPGAHSGVSCDSFCINPQRYLDYLLGRLGDLGVKTITAEVDSLFEVFILPGIEDVAGLVNCTGLAAGKLCGDKKVFPTRGQTLLVKGEVGQVSTRLGDGWTAYVVRRPGVGTILGGSYQVGDWNPDVDPELARKIKERCAVLAPELLVDGKFDVISEHVGRRPSREGGVRIEVEWVQIEGEKKFVCHNYGHSGAGYQSSYGTAGEALRLIQEALEKGN